MKSLQTWNPAMRGLFVSMIFCLLAEPSWAQSEPAPPLPSFDKIIAAVQQTTAGFVDYQPGDMIQRQQGEAIFAAIKNQGWSVSNQQQLLQKIPTEQEHICTFLLTANGRPFMRKIIGYPGGLDRVDHLLRLPDGQQLMKQLVNGKGGDRLIEYLTTSNGGKNLGKMLAKQSNTDFNQPTGRIYTAKALMIEIERQYAVDASRLAQR